MATVCTSLFTRLPLRISIMFTLIATTTVMACIPFSGDFLNYHVTEGDTIDNLGCTPIEGVYGSGVVLHVNSTCSNFTSGRLRIQNIFFNAMSAVINITGISNCTLSNNAGITVELHNITTAGPLVIEYSGNHTIQLVNSTLGYVEALAQMSTESPELRFTPTSASAFLQKLDVQNTNFTMACRRLCFVVELPTDAKFGLISFVNNTATWLYTTVGTVIVAETLLNTTMAGMMVARGMFGATAVSVEYRSPPRIEIRDSTLTLTTNSSTLMLDLDFYQGFAMLYLDAAGATYSLLDVVVMVENNNMTLDPSVRWIQGAGTMLTTLLPPLGLVVLRELMSLTLTIQGNYVRMPRITALAYSGLLDYRVTEATTAAFRAQGTSRKLLFNVNILDNDVELTTWLRLSQFIVYRMPDFTPMVHGLAIISFPEAPTAFLVAPSCYNTVTVNISRNTLVHRRQDNLMDPPSRNMDDIFVQLPSAVSTVLLEVVSNSITFNVSGNPTELNEGRSPFPSEPPVTANPRAIVIIPPVARAGVDFDTAAHLIAVVGNTIVLHTVTILASAVVITTRSNSGDGQVATVCTVAIQNNDVTATIVHDDARVNTSAKPLWAEDLASSSLIQWGGGSSFTALSPANMTVLVTLNVIKWYIDEVIPSAALVAIAVGATGVRQQLSKWSTIVPSFNNITISSVVGSNGVTGLGVLCNVRLLGSRVVTFMPVIYSASMLMMVRPPLLIAMPPENQGRHYSLRSVLIIQGNHIVHVATYNSPLVNSIPQVANAQVLNGPTFLRGVLLRDVLADPPQSTMVPPILDIMENTVLWDLPFATDDGEVYETTALAGISLSKVVTNAELRVHGNVIAVLGGTVGSIVGMIGVNTLQLTSPWGANVPAAMYGIWHNTISVAQADAPAANASDELNLLGSAEHFGEPQATGIGILNIITPTGTEANTTITDNTVAVELKPRRVLTVKALAPSPPIASTCKIVSARVSGWGALGGLRAMIFTREPGNVTGTTADHIVFPTDIDRSRFVPYGRRADNGGFRSPIMSTAYRVRLFSLVADGGWELVNGTEGSIIVQCDEDVHSTSRPFVNGITLGPAASADVPLTNTTSIYIERNSISLRVVTVATATVNLTMVANVRGIVVNTAGEVLDSTAASSYPLSIRDNAISVWGSYASTTGVFFQRLAEQHIAPALVNCTISCTSGTRLLDQSTNPPVAYLLHDPTFSITPAVAVNVLPRNVALTVQQATISSFGWFGGSSAAVQQEIQGPTMSLTISDTTIVVTCCGSYCLGVNVQAMAPTVVAASSPDASIRITRTSVKVFPKFLVSTVAAFAVLIDGRSLGNVALLMQDCAMSLVVTMASNRPDRRAELLMAVAVRLAGIQPTSGDVVSFPSNVTMSVTLRADSISSADLAASGTLTSVRKSNMVVAAFQISSVDATKAGDRGGVVLRDTHITIVSNFDGFRDATVSAIAVADITNGELLALAFDSLDVVIYGGEPSGAGSDAMTTSQLATDVVGLRLQRLRLAANKKFLKITSSSVSLESLIGPSSSAIFIQDVRSTSDDGDIVVSNVTILVNAVTSGSRALYINSTAAERLTLSSVATSVAIIDAAYDGKYAYAAIVEGSSFVWCTVEDPLLIVSVTKAAGSNATAAFVLRDSVVEVLTMIGGTNNNKLSVEAEHGVAVHLEGGSIATVNITNMVILVNRLYDIMNASVDPGLPFPQTGVAGVVAWEVRDLVRLALSNVNISVSCMDVRFCNAVLAYNLPPLGVALMTITSSFLGSLSRVVVPPEGTTDSVSDPAAPRTANLGRGNSSSMSNAALHGAVAIVNSAGALSMTVAITVAGGSLSSGRGSGIEVVNVTSSVSIIRDPISAKGTLLFVQRCGVQFAASASAGVVVVGAQFSASTNTVFALAATHLYVVSFQASTMVSFANVNFVNAVLEENYTLFRAFAFLYVDGTSGARSSASPSPLVLVGSSTVSYVAPDNVFQHNVVLMETLKSLSPPSAADVIVEISNMTIEGGVIAFEPGAILQSPPASSDTPVVHIVVRCNYFGGVLLRVGYAISGPDNQTITGSNTDCVPGTTTPMPTVSTTTDAASLKPTSSTAAATSMPPPTTGLPQTTSPAPPTPTNPQTTLTPTPTSANISLCDSLEGVIVAQLAGSLNNSGLDYSNSSANRVDADAFTENQFILLVRVYLTLSPASDTLPVKQYLRTKTAWALSTDGFTITDFNASIPSHTTLAIEFVVVWGTSNASAVPPFNTSEVALGLQLMIPNENCSASAPPGTTTAAPTPPTNQPAFHQRTLGHVFISPRATTPPTAATTTPAPTTTASTVNDGVTTTAGAAVAVASVVGGGGITSGPTATRFKALLALSSCDFSHTVALDFLTSPTTMAFGSAEGQYYRGGVVGSLLVFIACGVATVAAGVLLAWYQHRGRGVGHQQGDPQRAAAARGVPPQLEARTSVWVAGSLLVHFPSVLFVPFGILAEGIMVTSTATIVHAYDNGDVAIGVLGYAVVLGMLAYGWHTIYVFNCVLRPRRSAGSGHGSAKDASPFDDVDDDAEPDMLDVAASNPKPEKTTAPTTTRATIDRIFHAEEQWVVARRGALRPTTTAADHDVHFKQKHLHLFNDYRLEHYPILESTITAMFGVFEGLRLNQDAACYASVVAVLLLSTFLLVYSIWRRPALILAEAIAMYALNAVAVLASLLLVVGTFSGDDTVLSASDILSLIGMLLTALKVLSSLAALIVWLWATGRCSLAELVTRRFQRAERTPHVVDVDDDAVQPTNARDSNFLMHEELDADALLNTSLEMSAAAPHHPPLKEDSGKSSPQLRVTSTTDTFQSHRATLDKPAGWSVPGGTPQQPMAASSSDVSLSTSLGATGGAIAAKALGAPSSPEFKAQTMPHDLRHFADQTFELLRKRQEDNDKCGDTVDRPLARFRITQTTTTIELEDL